jgi:hypothetical protein
MDLNPSKVGLDDVAYAIMSPATLRELISLPESVDRRFLRALVREAVASGKESIQSVGEFFDYLDGWHRSYRLAAAEGCGVFVSVG